MRHLLAALLLALLLTAPGLGSALAEDLIVEHNPTDASHFSSIQAAIDHAAAILRNPVNTTSFRILVQADPVAYTGPITPISNVPIIGSSTAGTFLVGGGSGTLIALNNVNNVTIRNFTFLSSAAAISVTNSSQINISNNVFLLGTGSTAIQLQNASSTSIVNNTFYNNGTAISTNSDITISNDIFVSNGVAIASSIPLTGLSYSDFFNNSSNGVSNLGDHSIPSQAVANANPLFVDPGARDFHLQSGSPCKNSGNPNFRNSFDTGTSDMGAYGGPNSDFTVATVTGVTSSLILPSVVRVNWNATSDSSVTFYRVYYGTSASDLHGSEAAEGPSPIPVPAGTTQATLSNIDLPAPAVPAAPTLTALTPLDHALQVSWTAVPGATGYRVFYSTQSFGSSSPPATHFNVSAPATTCTIPGLSNGTTYYVAVSALAQPQLFISVTAVKDASVPSSPGSGNESPLSTLTVQALGAEQESPLSNLLSEFPEAIYPFPNLKGNGCFIATAAYGFYSAPQVQALRSFRDRYLLTNAPGRAFVSWYYRRGPRAAEFLNAHPWLKPPVRVALFPLIAVALFLLYTSSLFKTAVLLLMALILFKTSRRRGIRMPLPLTLVVAVSLAPAPAAEAAEPVVRPHWALELKGGAFFPDMKGWSTFYGDSFMGEYGGALSYKFLRGVEVGVEGLYARKKGKGQQPRQGNLRQPAGQVTFEHVPLNVYILGRGIVKERQWLVPYAGFGYTRMFYREDVKGQGSKDGSVDGFHARGGVQLLLDRLEPETAGEAYLDYGVHHSYFIVEGRYTRAMADTVAAGSVNIGGSSCLAGFLFEF